MKFILIYPKWPKLDRQTEFHLPPHGPVVFAGRASGRYGRLRGGRGVHFRGRAG